MKLLIRDLLRSLRHLFERQAGERICATSAKPGAAMTFFEAIRYVVTPRDPRGLSFADRKATHARMTDERLGNATRSRSVAHG